MKRNALLIICVLALLISKGSQEAFAEDRFTPIVGAQQLSERLSVFKV
jgi:hypothetical protein